MVGYIYAILFLVASILITLRPLPGRGSLSLLSPRFLAPVLVLIAAGFALGQSGGATEFQYCLDKILQFLQAVHDSSPTPIQDPLSLLIRWIGTASGLAGFAATLALTLLFLWVYVFVRLGLFGIFSLLLLLIKLFAFLKRFIYRLVFRKNIPLLGPFPATLPGPAGFLEPSVNLFVLALGLGFAALPCAAGKTPFEGFLAALFWAGIWAAILEIRAWFHAGEAGQGDFSGGDEPGEEIDPIEELYHEYQRRHPDHILLAWNEPARTPVGKGASSVKPPAADLQQRAAESRFRTFGLTDDHVDRLLEAWEHFHSGGDLLFTETLGRLHFVLVGELVHLSVQHGAPVLILCPEGTADEMSRAVFAHFRPKLLAHALRTKVYGKDPIGADVCPDVVVCPADLLDALLDHPVMAGFCKEMNLFVALGVERINRPRLRYQILRMNARREASPFQLLFHTEPFSNAEPGVREVASFHNIWEGSLNPDISAMRYLLVWDAGCIHEPKFRETYLRTYKGHVDAPVLLSWLPWDRDFSVTYLDPLGRRDRDLLERIQSDLAVHFSGSRAHSRDWMQLDETSIGYIEPENTVVVTEDVSNLAEAVYRNYSFDSDGSVLVCVTCNNYLLRDFLVECFHGQRDAGEYRLPDKSLLPMVALSRGGLMDLARGLRSALSSGTGLSREETQRFLAAFPFTPLMEALQIDATFAGLARLFKEAFGNLCNLKEVDSGKELRYVCKEADPRTLGMIALQQSEGTIRKNVSACDFGLCLTTGTYTLIDGEFYRIEKLNTKDGFARIHHAKDGLKQRYRYFFDRTYRVEDFKWQEGDPVKVVRGTQELEIRHWHAHLKRTTKGYATAAEALRFLDPDAPDEQREYTHDSIDQDSATCKLRWRNLLEFKFLNLKPNANDRGQARLAFTLCALIQDALLSLFPGVAERIAVLSPQATSAGDQAAAAFGPSNFPLIAYPKFETQTLLDDQADASTLAIYVIEDADEDLGVVRSFKDDYEHILGVVYDYLLWASQKDESSLYHSFGAKKLHEVFDYRSASEVLCTLFPGRRQPNTARRPDLQVPEGPKILIFAPGMACDFCADPLMGPHNKFPDGRLYCNRCKQSAVTSAEQSKRLFAEVVRKMERRYHISLPTDFPTKMVDADEMARILGGCFIPTDDFDPRTVGLVERRNGKHRMVIERDAPQIALMATFAHELTHIWQLMKFGGDMDHEICEGQARYIEIDFIRANDGERLARRMEEQSETGQDIYSRGWRKVRNACHYKPSTVFRCFEQMLKQW